MTLLLTPNYSYLNPLQFVIQLFQFVILLLHSKDKRCVRGVFVVNPLQFVKLLLHSKGKPSAWVSLWFCDLVL